VPITDVGTKIIDNRSGNSFKKKRQSRQKIDQVGCGLII